MAAGLILTPAVSVLHDVEQLRQAAALSHCTMHDLDVECGPSSFRMPELLSYGTALPKTGVLAFCRVVSVDTNALWINFPVCSFNATWLYDVIIQNVAT